MLSLFLTADELIELTGFRDRHAQARWLDRNRWRYCLNRRNEPRVAREHFSERLGCGVAPGASHAAAINEAAAHAQPNFAAIGRR